MTARQPSSAPFHRLGVVIPIYGHSRLAVEAIQSACRQSTNIPFTVIAVDDGSLDVETQMALESCRRSQPRHVTLRQRNGGLSAARNLGVQTLLSLHDDLDAVFFLDADNR